MTATSFKKTLVFLVVSMLFPAIDASSQDFGRNGLKAAAIKVMTRNIFLGADLNAFLEVESLEEVPPVVAQALEAVMRTNFPERAQALADEIEREQPDIIGLQEATLFRIQSPGDALAGNPVEAQDVLLDYLQILLDALTQRGIAYDVAAVVENADFELPSLAGFDSMGNPLLDDVRLTDRDVILARRDVVVTSNPRAEHYEVNLLVPFEGDLIEVPRGFVAVDARIRGIRGASYRIVNTHLEGRGALDGLVQTLQATELIGELLDEELPIILLGDFNSSPDDSVGLIVPPYAQLDFAGFEDAWRLGGDGGPGFTCCQDRSLTNPESENDERIDHIFFRPGEGADFDFFRASLLPAAESAVVGADPAERTAGGLWPSDHAGVVSRLRFLLRTGPSRDLLPMFSDYQNY